MSSKESVFQQPIIIIGAARSGTNMLRDFLTALPGFQTWPCDEINYIWRHENIRCPHDELEVKHCSPKIIKFIHRQFEKIAVLHKKTRIVEKTCANSLRIPFVQQIFPEAKFVVIVRDGRDVVASALKRWKAQIDIKYLLKKSRYVPLVDLPYYAVRYASHRLHRITSKDKRIASWGPRFKGIDIALQEKTLPEVCALQWKACVNHTDAAIKSLSSEQVLVVRYESIVTQPQLEFTKLKQFLGLPKESVQETDSLFGKFHSSSIQKSKTELAFDVQESISSILEPTLNYHGYL